MNAAPRAASISALSRAGAGGCVGLLAAGARRRAPTYVTTHGISMEPRFHTGDLAILRSAAGLLRRRRRRLPQRLAEHRRHAPDRRHGRRPLRDPGRQQRLARRGPPVAGPGPRHALRPRPAGRQGAGGAAARPAPSRASGSPARVLGAASRRPGGRHGRRAAPARAGTARLLHADPGARRGRSRWPPAPSPWSPRSAAASCSRCPSTQRRRTTMQVTQQGKFTYTRHRRGRDDLPDGRVATGDTVWTKLASGLTVSFTDTVTGPGIADLRGALRLDVVDRLRRRLERLPEQQPRRRPARRARRRPRPRRRDRSAVGAARPALRRDRRAGRRARR